MHLPATRLMNFIRKLAGLALALMLLSLAAPDASAQYGMFGPRGGFYGRGPFTRSYYRPYGPQFYSRGYAGTTVAPRAFAAPLGRPYLGARGFGRARYGPGFGNRRWFR